MFIICIRIMHMNIILRCMMLYCAAYINRIKSKKLINVELCHYATHTYTHDERSTGAREAGNGAVPRDYNTERV